MKKLWIAAALTTGVVAANADVYEQVWTPTDVNLAPGIASSGLTSNLQDADGTDQIAFDDVVVGGPGWQITEIIGRGSLQSGTGGLTNAIVTFSSAANVASALASPHRWTIGITAANFTGTGTDNRDLVLSGLDLSVPAGTWWLSIYTLQANDPGIQWFWKCTSNNNTAVGGKAKLQNPGGTFWGDPNPIDIEDIIGAPIREMAFKITYNPVPEPATLLALGAGLALLAARRRK